MTRVAVGWEILSCARVLLVEGASPFPYELLSGGEAPDKLRISSSAAGPTDRWRVREDRAATSGTTLSVHACVAAGVEDLMLEHGFRGIKLEFRSARPAVVSQAYPSAQKRPDVVAAEPDRLASLGKIH